MSTEYKRILHVDINSYFAIIMQQENPSLRGLPVGVIKAPKRGLIIAASKEAKKYGIKTGWSVKDARAVCPGIVLVPAMFDYYLSATKKLDGIFHEFTPNAFLFSLDEAFLDLTGDEWRYPSLHEVGFAIQKRIKEELGEWVTCNVGISYNRLLAKIAGEISSKGSVTEITAENRDKVLSQIAFADVCGVGIRLERKLRSLGVTTPIEIRKLSDEVLAKTFGPFWSEELKRISFGEDSFILREEGRGCFSNSSREKMKSVSRSCTGYRLCDDDREIKSILYNLCAEISFKARKMGLVGREFSVWLEGEDQCWWDHVRLKRHLNSTQEVFSIIYGLYYKWQRSFKVIRFGVRMSLLVSVGQQSLSMFGTDNRQEQLYHAIDSLAHKYGLFTVHSGALVNHNILMPEVTGFLGDKPFNLG